ncbi:hypothetical protein [Stanieria cyanosphaera]|uniref:hypothetical protein n=1 Tax=Stanieria cyanosphaera TaxID=102116 RepID=UPI0002F12774|nr:hypothetical protein [Stanieria cyanosphaera]
MAISELEQTIITSMAKNLPRDRYSWINPQNYARDKKKLLHDRENPPLKLAGVVKILNLL